MLLVVFMLSALTVVVLTTRWVLLKVDSLGRVRPFPAVSVGAAVGVMVITGVPVLLHARQEADLSMVASRIVGFPVSVQCKTLGQSWVDAHNELGYVRFDANGVPEHETILAGEACDDLQAWQRSDHDVQDLEQVIAVHVLTHEAMHMQGTIDEARAECRAMQRDAVTAQALGANREQAIALAQVYWSELYPQMPAEYRSADCAPGASMDEGLPDTPWG